MDFLVILFSSLHILFALLILFLTIAFMTGAPFVPTTANTSKEMLRLARLRKGMIVYDLGSGDGRLLLAAARYGARATGFEINPFLVLWSKGRALVSRDRSLVTVCWKNFWNSDFSDADVVFVYLLPWRMEKLEKLLRHQLKPGALVVSNSFVFPSLAKIAENPQAHVYVFRM